jgi:hypothetical protein
MQKKICFCGSDQRKPLENHIYRVEMKTGKTEKLTREAVCIMDIEPGR